MLSMVSLCRGLVTAALLTVAGAISSAWHTTGPQADIAIAVAQSAGASPSATDTAPPKHLQDQIDKLGNGFDGRVGIAVKDVSSDWTAGHRAALITPQQSVSKLWVAITLLDEVDQQRISLTDPMLVRKDDLTVFHQPIRARLGTDGYSTTVEELLRLSIAKSDNTANDVLLRKIGGPDAVRGVLTRKQLAEIAFGPGERSLQSAIAGLEWQQDYSEGRAFFEARAKLAVTQRDRALSNYVMAPPDAATPDGLVRALASLHGGELLSPASTALLLDTMKSSETGKLRLRAGLAAGWTLAHKTGTGQELGKRATAFNDVGLLTSPAGRTYAVAVMVAETKQPIEKRQQLIADVARAIVDYDNTIRGNGLDPREMAHQQNANPSHGLHAGVKSLRA